jgi:hypothetical protein
MPLCKDASEIVKVNALIGENGLIGTNGVTVESRKVDVVNTATGTLIGPGEFRNSSTILHPTDQKPQPASPEWPAQVGPDFSGLLTSLKSFTATPNIRVGMSEFPPFADAVAYLMEIGASHITILPELQASADMLFAYARQTEPVTVDQMIALIDATKVLKGSTPNVAAKGVSGDGTVTSESGVPDDGSVRPSLTSESISSLVSSLNKTTTILLPIDGFYIKGENTCVMTLTTTKEIEGL